MMSGVRESVKGHSYKEREKISIIHARRKTKDHVGLPLYFLYFISYILITGI